MVVLPMPALACTGITLTAEDGSVVYGRTLEWGAFDIMSRIMVVGRGAEFAAKLNGGKTWRAKYGVVGIDAVEKPVIVDGLNEAGLAVGVFYLPGFTEFEPVFKRTLRSHQSLLSSLASISRL